MSGPRHSKRRSERRKEAATVAMDLLLTFEEALDIACARLAVIDTDKKTIEAIDRVIEAWEDKYDYDAAEALERAQRFVEGQIGEEADQR